MPKPLRHWRTSQLLSMRALAEKANVTQKTLNSIEYGRRRPNYGTMRSISAALGVPPEHILEFVIAVESRQKVDVDGA